MAIDPVCGMEVDEATAAARSEFRGRPYYFCAPGCKRAFDREPEKFLDAHGGDGQARGPKSHGGGHGDHREHSGRHRCC